MKRAAAVALLVVLLVGGCGDTKSADPAAVFNRWNHLARKGDPAVQALLCSGAEVSDELADPVSGDYPGFADPGPLTVAVEGTTATVSFLDSGPAAEGDESDVYVTLTKEAGSWKVCRAQVTAPGGFG